MRQIRWKEEAGIKSRAGPPIECLNMMAPRSWRKIMEPCSGLIFTRRTSPLNFLFLTAFAMREARILRAEEFSVISLEAQK